jgi:hypothetical protein
MPRGTSLLLFTLALYAVCAPAASQDTRRHASRRHKHQARVSNELGSELKILGKRYDNARMTYYKDGQGACGWDSKDSDWIVAIPQGMWDNGHHCGAKIHITANGKDAIATIVDECPGCSNADLDLSQGLFEHFAPTSQGVVHGSWTFQENDRK